MSPAEATAGEAGETTEADEPGANIRQRLYVFVGVLIVVFLIVIALAIFTA